MNFFKQALANLEFLEPDCPVLWTHLESSLEGTVKTDVLEFLAIFCATLRYILDILFKCLSFLATRLCFLVRQIFRAAGYASNPNIMLADEQKVTELKSEYLFS